MPPKSRRKLDKEKRTSQGGDRQLLRFLTVGQTARILGISPSTLRLWESVGLVTPARSSGKFRLYTPELLEVLKRIKYLHDVKRLNVPGIKEAMGHSLPAKANTDGRKIPDFGPRLRKLRKRQGLSLAEAADRAGVSAGFLSSVELSHAKPSVSTLSRLAGTYGTTVLELYDLPKRPDRIVHPGNRQSIQTQSGVRMELLSTGTKMLETMLMRVPAATGSDGAYTHQGETGCTCCRASWKSGLMRRSVTSSMRAKVFGSKAIGGIAGTTPAKRKR